MLVRVQTEDFDAQALTQSLRADPANGALVTFTGLVRDFNERPEVQALILEHYPAMTEKALIRIGEEALARWRIRDLVIVHRVGRMTPGDQIVFVAVAGSHRGDAFAACEYIMDTLKTKAPFWKKEETASGDYWVSARESDSAAAQRWLAGERDDR